jgi:hypothetical protein
MVFDIAVLSARGAFFHYQSLEPHESSTSSQLMHITSHLFPA